jgi:type IV secretion system protein VirD4
MAPLPIRDLTESSESEGELKPSLDEPAPVGGEIAFGEECLFDDESDAASDDRQMQRVASGRATIRQAHAVTRDDDDILPAF